MEFRFFVDRETGESLDEPVQQLLPRIPEVPMSNAETGEPEINVSAEGLRRRIPFQVNLIDDILIF